MNAPPMLYPRSRLNNNLIGPLNSTKIDAAGITSN